MERALGRVALLLVLVAVVLGSAFPAAAQAWTTEGAPLEKEATIELLGPISFESVFGGIAPLPRVLPESTISKR
jgi:hypothetical protein